MSPARQELTDFVAGVYRGTSKNKFKWEATADPDVLTAPLEQGFTIRLERVPDFSGESDVPDHILYLLKSGKVVFQVDRRELDGDSLSARVGYDLKYAYDAFNNLWEMATLSSKVIPPEVNEVNRLLWSKLDND
jgi:hypothetical protein